MDTASKRIDLGTIVVLLLVFLYLLLCLPYHSTAEVIYSPVDLITVNCGSSTNFSTLDGRNWTADIKFLSENHGSVAAPPLTPTTISGPYTYARLSHSQFTYSFRLTTQGPNFLRLFFYSTSYLNFDRSQACFSVKAGPYTLLQDFNASLHADTHDDPAQPDILFREYCIYIRDGERLNITFIPSTTPSYAFINGIEIVSMPPYLYYTNNLDDSTKSPQLVGPMFQQYPIENNSALETMYRLKVAGREIAPSEDTGMLRTWYPDNNYLTTQSASSVYFGKETKLSFTMISNYTAPDQVYRTVRSMGRNGSINMGFNLTWQLPVDSGFTYLLRLHFCQLDPSVNRSGDLEFYIFIADQLATDRADVLMWTDGKNGVPVVKDYAVYIPGNLEKAYLLLKMHPHPESLIKDATLNAIELFKISDPTGDLAGAPDPYPPLQSPKIPPQSNGTMRTLVAVAGAVSGVVLLSFISAFFLIKRRKNVAVHKDSNKKDGTSLGRGSL